MPAEVLRLGGVARLDPDPERTLAVWRSDVERGALDDPAETRQRLDEEQRGEAFVVQLGLFADVLETDSLRRIDGLYVPGLWFQRGAEAQNTMHAAEIVADQIEAIRDDLRQHGIAVATDDLAQLPIKIEVDPELERVL